MLQSLAVHCHNAKVFVLCMDAQTEELLSQLNLPYVTCIRLSQIEDEALLAAKASRGVAEYCWTLSPCVPWYVLQNNPDIEFITYLDADLLFYSDVEPLFDEIGQASVVIIEHRFSDRLKDREVNGRFCVEWVSFRRNTEGISCLSRWREQCIEWCYYRLEDGKMGDQKYLDEWPERYSECHILQHPGAGIAPWNYDRYQFGQNADGEITVQGQPLIFYHFHQFQLLDNGNYDRLSSFYTAHCKEPESVYAAYEHALEDCLAQVRRIDPQFKGGLKPVANVRSRRFVQKYMPMWAKEVARRFLRY